MLRSAVTQSRRHAFATALGINTGALARGVGAALGVSALLTASPLAYAAVRIAGAVYMVWLGIRLLHQAIRGHRADPPQAVGAGAGTAGGTADLAPGRSGEQCLILTPAGWRDGQRPARLVTCAEPRQWLRRADRVSSVSSVDGLPARCAQTSLRPVLVGVQPWALDRRATR